MKLGDNYVVFAPIATPDGKQFFAAGEWFGLFPSVTRSGLGLHRSCTDNTDCRTGWLCCHRTCRYTAACS